LTAAAPAATTTAPIATPTPLRTPLSFSNLEPDFSASSPLSLSSFPKLSAPSVDSDSSRSMPLSSACALFS